jgi:hypothetical protein
MALAHAHAVCGVVKEVCPYCPPLLQIQTLNILKAVICSLYKNLLIDCKKWKKLVMPDDDDDR